MSRPFTLHVEHLGSGPPLLLLHGFMGSAREFMPPAGIIHRLADEYHCVAVDLPGHGRSLSPDPRQYTFEATARTVMEVLGEQSIERCGLYGYSMGGRLALYLAVNHPSRFTGAVLESSSAGLRTEHERVSRIASDTSWRDLLAGGDMRAFLDQWYRQPVFADLTAAGRDAAIAARLANDPAGLALSLEHLGTGVMPSLWDRLPAITIPALLLVGSRDSKFRAIAEQMALALPRASVEVVADAGHNVHAAHPDVVAAAIRRTQKSTI